MAATKFRVSDIAKRMGKSGHARSLDLLAEIDRQTKTGIGDAATNVERFILSQNS